jgi:murein DD-endopeptidase MepM/ murein hydrolase activator NlpD
LTMGRGVPSNQIALAQQYGRQYGIDPRLLLAIGGHETHWGSLGAGRQGYTLGYGATDTGLLNQYAGVANQYRGAAKTLAGWGARSIGDVLAGKASRYATDPGWERGVASTYRSLGGDLAGGLPTAAVPTAAAPAAVAAAPGAMARAAPAPLDRGAIIRQAFLGQLQGKPFSLLDLMRQLREQRTTAAAQPAAPAVGQAAAPTAAGVAPSDKGRADPLKGKIIGRPYEGTHADIPNWESQRAIDVAAPFGSPVYSPFAGSIGPQFGSLGASPNSRFGGLRMHVVGPTDEAYLAHLSRFAPGIRPGRRVRPGQLLGYSGSASGVSHLHEALKYGDPYSLIR